VYSLGWGLTDRGQTGGVLLGQAFDASHEAVRALGAELATALGPFASCLDWTVGPWWDRACLRISATVRDDR
jgi:hypothetical protein